MTGSFDDFPTGSDVGQNGGALRVSISRGQLDVAGSRNWTAQRDPVTKEPGGPVEYSLTAGWQFEDGKLRIFADRLGMIPLYVYVDSTTIVVTDRIVNLRHYAPSLELDHFEVAVFMKLGVYLGAGTPFRRVQRLRPGEVLVWNSAQVSRMPPPEDWEPFRGTRSQVHEKMQRLFAQSIRKRVHRGHQPVVGLTGGRDSRHVLAELVRQGVPDLLTITVSRWDRYQEDLRVAKAVSACLDVPHKLLKYRQDSFFERLEEQILTNNFETVQHEWTQVITDELAGQRCIIYDGIAGDGLLDRWARSKPTGMLKDVQTGSMERIADSFVKGNYALPRCLSRLPELSDFEERLRNRLVAELSRHSGAPDMICRFMFEHRARRSTGAQAMAGLGNKIEICLPYLDVDIVALAFSLPVPDYWHSGLRDEIIAANYPDLSRIPYEGLEMKATIGPSRFADWLLLWKYLPRLFRGCASELIDTLFVLSRFAVSFVKLRMSDFFYISERQMYISVLRKLSRPGRDATQQIRSTQD